MPYRLDANIQHLYMQETDVRPWLYFATAVHPTPRHKERVLSIDLSC